MPKCTGKGLPSFSKSQTVYTHEIFSFEFFRDCSYSFQGSVEFISITVTVSLFFQQNAVTGDNPPRAFQELSASTVT